ncbi:MAG TPA: aldo/keto reductase [Acidimicrobiales bacterium]|nr:aldo/keto reductase [Acidimicrobiales bacterium]
MEQRTVGRSGLQVSAIGLGCNNFGTKLDQAASTAVVAAALDAGVTFFDTSNTYGNGVSEEHLGAALASARDDVVVATKFSSRVRPGPYGAGASRKHLVAACEDSLRRLGTDHIDLYYQHKPDRLTPVEETLDALDDLVRAGKVRYVASSNLAGWEIARADHVARERRRQPFVASQSEWSLLERGIEAEVVPACLAYGVGIVPYFPLAAGLLTGKYRRGQGLPAGSRLATMAYYAGVATDEALDKVERIDAVCRDAGLTLLEAAVGWLLHQPGVPSVLTGATSPEQVAANAAAASVPLSPDLLAALDDASGGPPSAGGLTTTR